MSPQKTLSLLRHVALIEGVSFLLLLGIAMPLKYLADLPQFVTWVGWAHGALFVALCWLLLQAMLGAGLSFGRAALVFAASLIPFGPFIIDRRMKGWENETPPAK